MIKTCCTNIYYFVGLLTPHEKGESQTIKEKNWLFLRLQMFFPFFFHPQEKGERSKRQVSNYFFSPIFSFPSKQKVKHYLFFLLINSDTLTISSAYRTMIIKKITNPPKMWYLILNFLIKYTNNIWLLFFFKKKDWGTFPWSPRI